MRRTEIITEVSDSTFEAVGALANHVIFEQWSNPKFTMDRELKGKLYSLGADIMMLQKDFILQICRYVAESEYLNCIYDGVDLWTTEGADTYQMRVDELSTAAVVALFSGQIRDEADSQFGFSIPT